VCVRFWFDLCAERDRGTDGQPGKRTVGKLIMVERGDGRRRFDYGGRNEKMAVPGLVLISILWGEEGLVWSPVGGRQRWP
jgi:hypothetical protein